MLRVALVVRSVPPFAMEGVTQGTAGHRVQLRHGGPPEAVGLGPSRTNDQLKELNVALLPIKRV